MILNEKQKQLRKRNQVTVKRCFCFAVKINLLQLLLIFEIGS